MRRIALGLAFAGISVYAACTSDDAASPTLPSVDAGGLDVTVPRDGSQSDVGAPEDSSTTTDAPVTDAPSADADAGAVDASEDAADASDAADAADAADAPGSIGALKLDGVDDYVHFATDSDGGPSETAFSEELWFKTTTTLGNMIEVYGSGGGADRFIYTQNGKVCFYVYGPATTICSNSGGFNDGNWHHAAATLGATGGQQIYVDGVLEGTLATTTKSTFTGGDLVRIGWGHYGFNSALVFFNGQLDEVRLWKVERSAAEIAANYNHTIDPATPGLQGYWRLDESGDAGTAHDETAGAHDGVLTQFTFSSSPWVGPGAF